MNTSTDGAGSPSGSHVCRSHRGLARFLVNRFAVSTALASLALLIAVPRTPAQSNTEGGAFGRVIGASPAELAKATATIESIGTNVTHRVPVSPAGTFEFPKLPVGDYLIKVALAGREPLSQQAYINLGTTTTVRFETVPETLQMEKFVVTGTDTSPVNVSDPEINFNYRAETISKLPVPRDISSVALTVAGVSRGDDNYFGGRANSATTSFGGASIAENAYYLNGYNISDLRRGLGYSNVPFEFLQEFHIKQFGYSAEFGRSTGGVVDMVSKRGTNDYKASVNLFWEPASLRENSPDSWRRDGTLYVVNSIGEAETKRYNLQASGPLVKNHLYFYGLYEGRDTSDNLINGTNQWHFRSAKNPFWAGRLDWQINDNHAVEFTAFSDKSTRTTARYDYQLTSANNAFQRPAALGKNVGNVYDDYGGINEVIRYTGRFSEDLNLSVLFGTGKRDASLRTDVAADPWVTDNRTGSTLSGYPLLADDFDRRKALRVDGSYKFSGWGSHLLKFGYDRENNVARTNVDNSGGLAIVLDSYSDGGYLQNGAVAPNGTTAVAARYVYKIKGDFRVETGAVYAEDNWKLLNDRLLLRLGVRRETFDNQNVKGVSFFKLDNQWAPRLSFAYDLKGDGLSKVVGGWGRYYLQVPAQVNIRLAGGETYYGDFFVLNGLNPNGTPILGPQVGDRVYYSPGVPKDPATMVDANIRPMYQDELMLGYETALGRKWKASLKGVYKNLPSVVEDEAVDVALNNYAASKGYNNFNAYGFEFYVLTNPGRDLNFSINMTKDLNADGIINSADQTGGLSTMEKVHIPAAELGYPRAIRKYYAGILELEHPLADKWFGNFSYTWMQSYGNYEGMVLSDVGQDDGTSLAWDIPGLVDNSYGKLPNDRRHTFKASGGYQLTKEILLTGNFLCQSGRPLSGLGYHPTDPYAGAYGPVSYFIQGQPAPRGTLGRTPWVTQLDLGLRYKPTWGRDKLTLGVDVFNVANSKTVTAVRETAETTSGEYPEPRFLRARAFQAPRAVRLSATYDF